MGSASRTFVLSRLLILMVGDWTNLNANPANQANGRERPLVCFAAIVGRLA